MSTAVAPATVPQVPLAPPPSEPESSPQTSFHARSSPNQAERSIASAAPRTNSPNAPIVVSEGTAKPRITPDSKRSPLSARHGPPKIIVKKEPPSSPEVPAISRHRPRKLDLTSSNSQSQAAPSARPSAPLTSRESGTLAMHDVGLACLSPGFQTQDPSMREQLQRSYSVRDQQRNIIESRLQKTAKPTDPDRSMANGAFGGGGMKTPSMTKKRPPNGLSIVPPSHEQFANERVIQSAPLNQSFTGRQQAHPLTRHIANQSSNLSHTSHIHHPPATQTNNRLPPISDVFAADGLGMQRREGQYHSNSNSSHSNHRPAFPSPGHPPPSSHPPPTSRARDFRSAEEAVAEMAQGREELLPKIVHYSSSNQPPTPPSPPTHGGATSSKHMYGQMNGEPPRSSRRRPRNEYERDLGTPPLGSGPEPRERRGPFGLGIDSPETQRKKKDEFLGLCARAWDLFHS